MRWWLTQAAEAAVAAAAVDAVPSSDHTQRGCSAPLLRHQHHDTPVQTRNLSRTRTKPARGLETFTRTRTHAHRHTRAGRRFCSAQQPKRTETPTEANSTAPWICAFLLRPTRKPARKPTPHPVSHFTPKNVIVGQGQRALRQLCGTVPLGEDAGQRTDRLVKGSSSRCG